MESAVYTPGHSKNATEFMSLRNLKAHAEFFLPHLQAGLSVLDCGCGPGSITLDIAQHIGDGQVVGVDYAESQIKVARAIAGVRQCKNARFHKSDVYSLSFEDQSFDCIFSHALFEHLADPVRALRELLRVLKPGGVIGVCSPDWEGFVLSPPSDALNGGRRYLQSTPKQKRRRCKCWPQARHPFNSCWIRRL